MGTYGDRIGSGSYSGDERWHPSDLLDDTDRQALEAAYGQGPFSDENWAELLHHLDMFAAFAVIERNSITVVQMRKMLAGLNKAATDLALSLAAVNEPEAGFAMNQIVDDHWEGLFHRRARHVHAWGVVESDLAAELASHGHENAAERAEEIALGWQGRRLFAAPPFADDLINLAYELAAAAAKARESFTLGREATTSEGDAWKSMIQGLARWATANRYSKTVSKGSDKAKGPDTASPFVHFVYALQERMPATIRRHHQSKVALATGINRALKPRAGQKKK